MNTNTGGTLTRSLVRLILALTMGAGWCALNTAALADGWHEVPPDRAHPPYGKPWRFVGTVTTFWKDGSIRGGSGALIGRSHVLTAGHVLWDFDKKQQPVGVMFTPGEYYGRAAFGSANATKWGVAKPFMSGKDRFVDYGVIRLNRPLGDRTLGWFHLSDWYSGSSASYYCRINGYTPEYNSRKVQLYGTSNLLSSWRHPMTWVAGDKLRPIGGLSGSPAWFSDGRSYRIVGIYTFGWLDNVHGVKLTRTARIEIQNWIAQNP